MVASSPTSRTDWTNFMPFESKFMRDERYKTQSRHCRCPDPPCPRIGCVCRIECGRADGHVDPMAWHGKVQMQCNAVVGGMVVHCCSRCTWPWAREGEVKRSSMTPVEPLDGGR